MLAGTFFSLLGVPSFHILLGLGRTKQIFVGNIVQSCTNAVLVLTLLLLGFTLSVDSVAIAVTTGMVIAHVYLVWQKRHVIKGYTV
jgi:Na+-driven multidrug efflux pump